MFYKIYDDQTEIGTGKYLKPLGRELAFMLITKLVRILLFFKNWQESETI